MRNRGYIPRVLNTKAIRERRESLGLTMEQAAHAAGMKRRTNWHAIESGTSGSSKGVRLGTLNSIAKALQCDPKDLLK